MKINNNSLNSLCFIYNSLCVYIFFAFYLIPRFSFVPQRSVENFACRRVSFICRLQSEKTVVLVAVKSRFLGQYYLETTDLTVKLFSAKR